MPSIAALAEISRKFLIEKLSPFSEVKRPVFLTYVGYFAAFLGV
jgi:hypothetical protein